MRAVELIICPTQASLFDLAALEETASVLDHAGLKKRAVVVVNCVPPGKGEEANFAEASAFAAQYGMRIGPRYICHRRSYVTSTNEGKGVTELGKAAKTAADEIRWLWIELNKLSSVATHKVETLL